MLFRVFPHVPGASADPLAVPRSVQGAGRHDNPDAYTALYLSRDPISAVAERIQAFRGQELADSAFGRPDGAQLSLAAIDDTGWPALVDLDDPTVLAVHAIRPSRVATGHRSVTQQLALGFFLADAVGLSWWSTLEASWTNVTIFRERLSAAAVVTALTQLTADEATVREAAEVLGVRLERSRQGRRGR